MLKLMFQLNNKIASDNSSRVPLQGILGILDSALLEQCDFCSGFGHGADSCATKTRLEGIFTPLPTIAKCWRTIKSEARLAPSDPMTLLRGVRELGMSPKITEGIVEALAHANGHLPLLVPSPIHGGLMPMTAQMALFGPPLSQPSIQHHGLLPEVSIPAKLQGR
jgi:hypothetical protein